MKFIYIVGLVLLIFGLTQCYAWVNLSIEYENNDYTLYLDNSIFNNWSNTDPISNYTADYMYYYTINTSDGFIVVQVENESGDYRIVVYDSSYSPVNYTIYDESGKIIILTPGVEQV
jgi:hypothetical protein